MQIGESFRTTFEEIRAHKLRSLFTLVGVILGTLALVVVLSLLEGLSAAVWKGLDDLGFDGVLVVSSKTPSDRVQRAKSYMSRGLRVEDETFIRQGDLIGAVAPVGQNRGIVQAGNNSRRATVYGVTPAFKIAKNRDVSKGRFISDRDQSGIAPVCVIGWKLKQRLFGGEEAIGKQLTVDGRRLTVVGIGRKFSTEIVDDREMIAEMDAMYVPLSVYQTMYGRKNSVSYVIVKARNADDSLAAEDQAKHLFTRAHSGVGDVNVDNYGKEMLKELAQIDTLLRNWLIVLFSIAGVSLVIGGVGIFSVLKISISERLYEIGLRKAIGASDNEIFVQFLIESMTLSIAGSAVGISAGAALVAVLSSKFPAGLTISTTGVLISAGFAIGVGLFAGLYPSLVAARLQPVEALRA